MEDRAFRRIATRTKARLSKTVRGDHRGRSSRRVKKSYRRARVVGGRSTYLRVVHNVPSFEQHRADAIAFCGKPYDEVHHWLDEFAGQPPYGMKHRKKRHHLAGIEDVRARWGDDAAAVARLHIVADLKTDGWTERDPFPSDEADYVRIGLF